MSELVDASGFPFRMNPPLHPSLRHVVPDLSVGTSAQNSAVIGRMYDETENLYASDADKDQGSFQNLRLGRLVMAKEVMTFSMGQTEERYGFRFLYNPTTFKGSLNVGDDFVPDPTNPVSAVLTQGLETISFEVMLNRMPEIQGQATRSDYPTAIDQEEWDALLERGTHYDIEYLYRISNGVHDTMHRKNTGDIGMLLPNPMLLFLGPFRTKGTLTSISVTDQIFSPDMVPMVSYVQIQFIRIFSTVAEEYSYLEAAGIPVGSSDSSGSGSGGAGAPSGSPGGTDRVSDPSGTGGQVSSATASMYSQFMAAYGGSLILNAFCWNGRPAGTPQDHTDGHACDFMVTSGGHPSEAVRAKGWEAAEWLKKNHQTLGVGYVIWDRKIWNRSRNAEGWRVYQAGATTNDAAVAHTNHIHVTSISHHEYR